MSDDYISGHVAIIEMMDNDIDHIQAPNGKEAVQILSDIPIADVVSVVRCKNCKHNVNPPEAGNADCDLFYGMTEQYGFCHRAERRTDE